MSERVLMKGNEALAEAAIRAGCRHFFGYPITPQTELAAYMSKKMPRLKQNRERDIRSKMTNCGPHRDDLCFAIREVDIRRFGSQGQQRTAALSLKLAEIEIVKQSVKDTPVLLLDDVLSELDSRRQRYLLESIHDIQTMITGTGVDDFVENNFKINRLFQVTDGTVSQKN